MLKTGGVDANPKKPRVQNEQGESGVSFAHKKYPATHPETSISSLTQLTELTPKGVSKVLAKPKKLNR